MLPKGSSKVCTNEAKRTLISSPVSDSEWGASTHSHPLLPENKMWELKKAERQRSITSLLNREPKDLVLLSKDGGRVAIQSLLVALHSPLLAELLLETGLGTAISLPFPLSALSSLADVLQDRQGDHDDGADVLQDKQGGHDDGVDCLQDVAFSLGISLRAVTSKLVKREVQSDRDEEEDVQDNLDEKNREEMIDKKSKAKTKDQIC